MNAETKRKEKARLLALIEMQRQIILNSPSDRIAQKLGKLKVDLWWLNAN